MAQQEELQMLRFDDQQLDEICVQNTSSRKRLFQRIAFVTAAAVLLVLALVGILVLSLAPGLSGASKQSKILNLKGVDWGLGTSSYQVEGAASVDGREPSIWDTFAKTSSNIQDGSSGNITSDQYSKYQDDVKLLKDLKVKYYRFSLSWSRVIQGAGSPAWKVNVAGVDYYNRLINELIQNNITPIVTLYHWDLPDNKYINASFWLQESPEMVVKEFNNYASTCFSTFGDRVKLWVTFNEPWSFTVLGYSGRGHAPGLNVPEVGVYRAGHNVLLAHAAAVDLYRQRFSNSQQGKIFIALNCDWAEPVTTLNEDVQAAEWALEFHLAWFADPIFKGDYPNSMKQLLDSRLPAFTAEQQALLKGSADLFGLNHYTTEWVSRSTKPFNNETLWFWHPSQTKDGKLIGAATGSDWHKVVPWGFRKMLQWVHNRYNAPEIWVLENGVAVKGEENMTNVKAMKDTFRVEFFRGYLTEMAKAIKDGVQVKTYIAWSLLDNFEWNKGFLERFGVVRVDLNNPSDLTRYVKKSALFLRDAFVNQNATAASN